MPMYEYECNECQHEFEELVRNSEEKVECPECGTGNVGRLLSRVAFSVGGKFTSSASGDACGTCSSSPSSCSSCSGH